MKKFSMLSVALLSAVSAFAQYDSYEYSGAHDGGSSGFGVFVTIVMVVYIIVSVVVLVRWWKMTKNVKEICQHVTNDNHNLTYLVAIGEKAQAEKAATKMLVDIMLPIYQATSCENRAHTMNTKIKALLSQILIMRLEVPDYVKSGEKFIDYLNSLTGAHVSYGRS